MCFKRDSKPSWERVDKSVNNGPMIRKFVILFNNERALCAGIDAKPVEVKSKTYGSDALLPRFEDIKEMYSFPKLSYNFMEKVFLRAV